MNETPHHRVRSFIYLCLLFLVFADGFLEGAPAEDGVALMRILDGIYESARTGHEVIL